MHDTEPHNQIVNGSTSTHFAAMMSSPALTVVTIATDVPAAFCTENAKPQAEGVTNFTNGKWPLESAKIQKQFALVALNLRTE